MSASHYTPAGAVAHHFDDAEQQYTAAELGMWLFLATEILFFGGLFCAYMYYRYWHPEAFVLGSHHLNKTIGTINTTILLLSSLTMALGVHAAQTSQQYALVRNLLLTILLGSAFLGIKGYEYYDKFEQNLVPGANFEIAALLPHDTLVGDESGAERQQVLTAAARPAQLFYSLYFVMTGLHALHMVIGIAILAVLTVAAARGAFSAAYFTPVEMTGLYWHFVDIVWVFLFPLLYLIH
jgi:cytochrome c oxidase subunit III